MDRRPRPHAPIWAELAEHQAGVVSRAQLLAVGLTRGQVGALRDAGRWQTLQPGVYATFTGPVPALCRAWSAVLSAGDGAALGGTSALWLHGLRPAPPDVMTVCVPHPRRVRPQSGVRVVVRRQFAERVHPSGSPPRIRVEEAVLDVADDAEQASAAVDVVLRAVQGRFTTAERLRGALSGRSRHRWRPLLDDLLADVADGVQSALERRWAKDVERAHGLPRGERNVADTSLLLGGGTIRRYRDVRYRAWRILVELDGQEAHPDWLRFRDRERDNAAVLGGDLTLRYGFREMAGEPCLVAVQFVEALRRQGWRGRPRSCGPGCPLG